MKCLFFLFVAMSALIWACGTTNGDSKSRQLDFDAVRKMEDSLGKTRPFDQKLASVLAEKQIAFVAKYPKDSVAAQMLLNAVGLRRAVGNQEHAIQLLDQFLSTYPDHKRLPEVLMLQGMIYEEANKLEKAKANYERIIKTYPNTKFASDAAGLLRLLSSADLNEVINKYEAQAAK